MKNAIAVLLMMVTLIACSPVGTKNVEKVDVDKLRHYSQSYDQIWERSIEWFAVNNIPLDKVDKTSGVIFSKYGLDASQMIIDCGEATGSIGLNKARIDGRYANINVIFRKRKDGVEVMMNVFGSAHVSLHNAYGLVDESSSRCYSTGILEAGFFDYMGLR